MLFAFVAARLGRSCYRYSVHHPDALTTKIGASLHLDESRNIRAMITSKADALRLKSASDAARDTAIKAKFAAIWSVVAVVGYTHIHALGGTRDAQEVQYAGRDTLKSRGAAATDQCVQKLMTLLDLDDVRVKSERAVYYKWVKQYERAGIAFDTLATVPNESAQTIRPEADVGVRFVASEQEVGSTQWFVVAAEPVDIPRMTNGDDYSNMQMPCLGS